MNLPGIVMARPLLATLLVIFPAVAALTSCAGIPVVRTVRSGPVVMKSPSDVIGPLYRKRFDKKTRRFVRERVSEDAVNFTVRRLVIAQGVGAAVLGFAVAANVAKGGEVGKPPGYEEAAKVKAEAKAAYIASDNARREALAAKAAADRAAGISGGPPPKPWER